MCFEISFLCYLVITVTTTLPHISMNRIYMCFEILFLCSLVFTLITTRPHISMNRVYMCFEIYLLCPLVFTLITTVPHLSMNNSVSRRIIFTCLYSYCTFDNLLSHSAHYNGHGSHVDFCKESKAIIQINQIPSTYRKSFPGKVCPVFSGIKI